MYGLATPAGSLDRLSKIVREREMNNFGGVVGGGGASDSGHCVYCKTTDRTAYGCAVSQTVPICPSAAGGGRYSSKFYTTIQPVPHRQQADCQLMLLELIVALFFKKNCLTIPTNTLG
jgi:hypothetical protein